MADKGAYEHQDEVTGVGPGSGKRSGENEHREGTFADPARRNEINPEERNRVKDHGPETQQPTRTVRKDEP